MNELKLLISSEEIRTRTAYLAEELKANFPDGNMTLVGILKGSFIFLADLARQLPPSVTIDFMQVSSYHGEKSSSGVVQIRKDLDFNIEGKNVVIVEDIVDTGLTLDYIRNLLSTRAPKSLQVISLLSKRQAKGIETAVEFVGFEISDEFVVGYGLDFDERYRNLSEIFILRA